jgi:Ran GTPase-activating protein (RanGAP) involved in mRNA processing and transport
MYECAAIELLLFKRRTLTEGGRIIFQYGVCYFARHRDASRCAVSLSDVLARCLLLKRIDLSFNLVGSRGAIALFRIFTHGVSISEVVLSQNPFGDEGGCALASAFQRCSAPTLELLELSSCDLSSSCMREFASAIQAQSKMISLDLSRNKIDSSGAECIYQSLSIHVSIENVVSQ